MDFLQTIAASFQIEGEITAIRRHGSGLVNDTYLVSLDGGGTTRRYILQRINQAVFPRADKLQANLRLVTGHIAGRIRRTTPDGRRPFECPVPIPCRDGNDYTVAADGSFWRAMTFIPDTTTAQTIATPEQAGDIGWALGLFHGLISDLNPEHLHESLPGFHNTASYLARYDQIRAQQSNRLPSPAEESCRRFIEDRRTLTPVLAEAMTTGLLRRMTIHGDPKISNFLLDEKTGRPVALIDLDTVMAGPPHFDIGDCLRSLCNPAGEDPLDPAAVRFDSALCAGFLQGYLKEAAPFLAPVDYTFLFDAIRLLPFELGLRFFTDHLNGNRYFKSRDPEQNLRRALVQFQLTESIEKQEQTIRTIIADCR